MEKLRVGFIGTGRISDLHAIEYLQNERAELVAVCDADADIARSRAAVWGVSEKMVFTDYHDMLNLKISTLWRFYCRIIFITRLPWMLPSLANTFHCRSRWLFQWRRQIR